MLNNTNLGFKIKADRDDYLINHLLYMDDLKLYANSKQQLHQLLDLTLNFSNDISMEFGIDKCKSINIHRGKLQSSEGFPINEMEVIEDLQNNESYKYLGFLQLKGINHTSVKEKLGEKFQNRVEMILKSHLNAGNKIYAINAFAIPALTYSFGIIKWSGTDLNNLERSIRVLMTKYRSHHPKSAIERMTLPRNQGGRGITNIHQLHDSQIKKLREYFHNKKCESHLFRMICESDKLYTPLHLANPNVVIAQESFDEVLITNWKQKELHGTHPNQLSLNYIDSSASNIWLSKGHLYSETEGFIIAIQDRVIATRNYRKYILQEDILDDRCRRCGSTTESIEHIIGGCSLLANNEYTKRHNNVAKIIHQTLAKKFKLIDTTTAYYKYSPANVLENQHTKIYWDWPILTDQTIPANRPDIVVFNKLTKKVHIIDVAVPLTTNLQSSYSTKISKYNDLGHEMRKLWHLEAIEVIPIVISTTGIVPTTLIQQLEKLSILPLLDVIQKSVILDTCHMTRKFLSM